MNENNHINNKYIIKVENLVTYLGNKYIHNNLNLTLKKKEILIILGKSGEGKSILLKILSRFVKPKSGNILIDNQNILEMSNTEFYKKIQPQLGILFQSKNTFDYLSTYENIAFGLRYSRKKYDEKLIEKIVLDKMTQVGLDLNIRYQSPSNFSEGVQRKICLARILAIQPKIMLYDEPTTGLDPYTANNINILIQKLRKEEKISSIVVTHDLKSTFQIADRIVVLHNSKICFNGTKKELYETKDPFISKFTKDFIEFPCMNKIPF